LISAVVLLWIGAGFHLIGFGTRFWPGQRGRPA